GGEVAPFEPPAPGQTLERAVITAHRDLFFRQLWAGIDRREVEIDPDFEETDEFFAATAVDSGVFNAARAVHRYAHARDALLSGCAVIARSKCLPTSVKDRYGFCAAGKPAAGWSAVRGVSDNTRRPGLLLSGPVAPAGKELVKLPHGVWFPVPAGTYFLDAAVWEAQLLVAWAVF